MTRHKKIPPAYLKNPLHFLALGFGSGLAPRAPGTFGTLAAIPVYIGLASLNVWLFIGATLLICIAGIYICGYTSRALAVHDHPGIVLDEIAGYLITMIAIPFDWRWMILGFVLFRIFDIVKPWPISWLDKKVSGGFGIMIDDILAGVFSLICLQLIVYFL